MCWLDVPKQEITRTAALLRCFRAFRVSGCRAMRDPADRFRVNVLDQEAARKRLWSMLDDAINRKAGMHGSRGRKDCVDQEARYWRDQRRLRELAQRICHYQFETAECRARFGDRLCRYDD